MAVLKRLRPGGEACATVDTSTMVDERVLAAALSQMGGWIQASRTACDCQGRDRCAFCERRCGLTG